MNKIMAKMIPPQYDRAQPVVLKSGYSIFLKMILTRDNGLYFTPGAV